MADVLVVEDSPTEVHAYGRILRDHGHKVYVASNGEEGLELAARVQPDVILMDVVMPGVNGFEATRLLRRESSTSQIPIIILSTKAQDTDRIWGLRQGAIDYLVKPVSRPVLLRSIDAALADA